MDRGGKARARVRAHAKARATGWLAEAKAWRSKARGEKADKKVRLARHALVRARRMLRDTDPDRSPVRGVTSWGAGEGLLAGLDVWQDLERSGDEA